MHSVTKLLVAALPAAFAADDHLSLLQKKKTVLLAESIDGAQPFTDNACDPANQLVFNGNNLLQNNLGNVGPDAGAEGMVFGNVFPHNSQRIDLRLSAADGYQKDANRNNGINHKMAKVNVVTGGLADLTFSFVDAASGDPVSAGPFYITYLDFDEQRNAGKAREELTIKNHVSVHLTESTKVSQTVTEPDSVSLSSTQFGNGGDNPSDVLQLTQDQKDKSVGVLMAAGTQSFTARFAAAPLPQGASNRFMLMAGNSNFVCDGSTPVFTPAPTPAPTSAGPPTTCGNACSTSMQYKKCAFWGDPHYQKTFNAAPPNYNNFFDLQGSGVYRLAQTKCGSVEIQAVQCPWWGGGAHVAVGFAFRVGSATSYIMRTNRGTTEVTNGGGVDVSQSGNVRTFTSSDECAQLITWQNGGGNDPGRGNYMNMEIKIDDPEMSGNCDGQRRNYRPTNDEILFTEAQLQPLYALCRFSRDANGNLLQQPDPVDPPAVSAEQACADAGVSFDDANAKCHGLNDDQHRGCILDFCMSGGDDQVIKDDDDFFDAIADDDKP